MAQEGQEIAQVQAEMLKVLIMLACSTKQLNNSNTDYLSVLPIDPEKPYIELERTFDGKNYKCYSLEDVQNSHREIVKETDMYNNFVIRADISKNSNLKDAATVFTPELFMKLGGQNSNLLLNTDNISILEDNKVSFNLNNNASEIGISSILIKSSGEEFNIGFVGENNSIANMNVRLDQFNDVVKNEAKLKDFTNLTEKKLFEEKDVPKDNLKNAGIKWDELSETNKKSLLDGKETSKLTVTYTQDNKKNYVSGYLQLSRIGGNKTQILFRPLEQQQKINRNLKL